MVFRKEKEYVIEIHPKHWWRLVCTKVFKNTKGEIISYSFTNPVIENSKYDFTVEETEKFLTVKEPVENDTFFVMYINWLNFRRSGFHQNLEVANKIRTNIINTLKERSIVLYGAGAFIQYDFNNRDKLIEDVC